MGKGFGEKGRVGERVGMRILTLFAAIFKWGVYNSPVMTNPKDPNSPPIPVPEATGESRETAREEEERKWRRVRRKEQLQTEEVIRRMEAVAERYGEGPGRLLDAEVIAQIKCDGKIAWMRADDVYPDVAYNDGLTSIGCDLLVLNGGEALAVEVNQVLRAEDVRTFVEKLPRLREFFPFLTGGRVLYGAMAFALEEGEGVRDGARKAAADAGIMLIHVDDESELTVLNPDREKLLAVAP